MSSRRSGFTPQIDKKIALAALLGLSVCLGGCVNSNNPVSSQSASSSGDFADLSGSSSSESFSTDSEISSSGASSSEYSSSSEFSSSSSLPNSEFSSGTSSLPNESSSSSSVQSSAASSSGSKSERPSSSSSVQSFKMPDVEVPTSPGTAVISNSSAVIDYSNAANGYVSVKYTGSCSKVKFRYTCGDKTYNFDIKKRGEAEYFPLSCKSGSYTFYIFENIEGNMYSTLLQQSTDIKISNDIKPYTYPNQYVNFSKKSQCVAKAAELCAGKTDVIDKISAIFLYISDNVSYDYQLAATVKSGYLPDPDKTLKSKKGICFDYASLMAAMLRSQGIPTRLVIGYAKTDIYHAWNEVYTEQTGWITPELLMSNRGYNIADATFYSSAADKKTISDYIMDSTNYTAVYYY